MFIEELNRHLAVSSIPELPRMLELDKKFWNIVSIREPGVPRPDCLRNAKRTIEVFFDDREDVPEVPARPPRKEHAIAMFKFVDDHPGEPVLVHCLAGLSRSPAFALGMIVRGLVQSGWSSDDAMALVDRAAELLITIRRRARPNVLLLQLCLEEFLPEDAARDLAVAFVNHPPLLDNRFQQEQERAQRCRAYRLGD